MNESKQAKIDTVSPDNLYDKQKQELLIELNMNLNLEELENITKIARKIRGTKWKTL